MPYSGISDSSLPKNVKAMSRHDREIFVAAFNAAMKTYNGDESKSFATAYAALKKEDSMDDVEKVGRRHSQKDIDAMKQMVIMLGELIGQEEAEHIEVEAEPTEKKDVRPEVGGGTDVDRLKNSDFIDGENRRFPIVTPADVSDAVSSFGRMGKPKMPFDEFKSKLMSLCRRKGAKFMAALPESWKKDIEKAESLERKISAVRNAFMKQFGFDLSSKAEYMPSEPMPWVAEIWDEYVIVCVHNNEYEPVFFKSNYTESDSEYTFDAAGNWEQVEQVWQVMPSQKFYVQIGKMAEEKQLVYGVVLKPEPFIDSQGDVMTKAEIEVAAHDFMEQSRLYDLFHKDSLSAKCAIPVESYIVQKDLDWDGKIIPAGSWVVVTHITDTNIWKRIKKGEINAYSIRGIGRREGV